MISSALEGAGFTVTYAREGLEGLEKLIESCVDIIVMDGALPKVYGEDARVRIRQASGLPIIVIGENHDVAESFELGADAFMSRPPILRELVARVRSLLDRASALIYRNPSASSNLDFLDEYPYFLNDDRYFYKDNQ